MQIAMLGPLEIRTDSGTLLEVTGTRLRRLLIVLAMHPRQIVSTARIVDAVWSHAAPAEPANAVQALVSRLRRAVPGIVLTSQANGYRLDVADDALDWRRFEHLATQGRSELAGSPDAAAQTLRGALALWRGPAIADAADAEFADATRARLEASRLAALHDRIDADIRRGHVGPIVAELEGLVAGAPLREAFVVLLMRALAATDERGRALVAFEQARALLSDELGVSPSAALSAEHVRILRSDGAGPHPSAEPSTETAPLTNLRTPLTSFVGREHDVAEVGALLDRSRLTTLVGPGGAGKTRLAAHAAHGRLDSMADGVWMVEFASISDPADMAPAVLASLGLRERALVRPGTAGSAATDSSERLVAALSRKNALLVFDNCEHLITDAAHLAHTVLGECPAVRIVATSREPLGVTGEALWPVEPLALPPLDDDASPQELMRYASVQLLVQRAAAVRPGFEVTDRNAVAIARICRALDGMPLAIELAAARIRTMPPDQLAARLGDRFDLLTGGSRTALPRHQTLRAVVDWSWELLEDAERALWRRLSIFAGGATLDAAEQICAGDDLPRERVLDVLTALVDKSLLVVRDDGPELRYLMLETIRAYGAARLDEAGDRATTRARHAAYFLETAAGARTGLLGPDQLEWFARLAADHDNLNAAMRGATAAGDAETAIGFGATLGWYWWLRGHRREGVELIKAAVALASDAPDHGLTRRGEPRDEVLAAAYTIGALLTVDGTREFDLSLRWFDMAAGIVARVGEPTIPILRMVPPLRAIFETFQIGKHDSDAGTDMPVDDPDPWIRATANLMRAHVMLNFGRDHAQAEADFARGLDLFRSIGERWGTAFSLSSLAMLLAWRGEFDQAVRLLDEALRCVIELGVREDLVSFRGGLIRVLWLSGDVDRAHTEIAQTLRDAARVGAPEERGIAAIVAGDIARWEGDLATARVHLDRGLELAREPTVAPQFQAVATSAMASLDAAVGDLDAARRRHRAALEIAATSFDAPVIAQVLVGFAESVALDGDAEHAAFLLGASTMIRGTPDRSLYDEHRIAANARAALGAPAFDAAYQRGLTSDRETVSAMTGVVLTGGVGRRPR